MAVPKKRTTSSKRNMRRSHHGTARINLASCPKCKQLVPGHTTCPNCGTYQGREVINVLAKLEKKERKAKVEELAEQQSAENKKP
jgi:large subunit ribosomal protein L32